MDRSGTHSLTRSLLPPNMPVLNQITIKHWVKLPPFFPPAESCFSRLLHTPRNNIANAQGRVDNDTRVCCNQSLLLLGKPYTLPMYILHNIVLQYSGSSLKYKIISPPVIPRISYKVVEMVIRLIWTKLPFKFSQNWFFKSYQRSNVIHSKV